MLLQIFFFSVIFVALRGEQNSKPHRRNFPIQKRLQKPRGGQRVEAFFFLFASDLLAATLARSAIARRRNPLRRSSTKMTGSFVRDSRFFPHATVLFAAGLIGVVHVQRQAENDLFERILL